MKPQIVLLLVVALSIADSASAIPSSSQEGNVRGAVGDFFRNLKNKLRELFGRDTVEEVACPENWMGGPDGTCFFIPESPQENNFGSYHESWRKCEAIGGRLVSIETEEKQKFVEELLTQSGAGLTYDFWTSGNRLRESDHHWYWNVEDGPIDSQEFRNWYQGQPDLNSGYGYEECIFIGHKNDFNYQWHDHRCNYRCSYVCEREP